MTAPGMLILGADLAITTKISGLCLEPLVFALTLESLGLALVRVKAKTSVIGSIKALALQQHLVAD